MFCARCRKTFSKDEMITWAVLHGTKIALPTCYDDRLCGIQKPPAPAVIIAKIKPVIEMIPFKPKSKKEKKRDIVREMTSKFVRPWK